MIDEIEELGYKKEYAKDWIYEENKWKERTDRYSYSRGGVLANNVYFTDGKIILAFHDNYNGSDKQFFGGADKWPVLDIHISFCVGEEEKRERLAIELAKTIEKFFEYTIDLKEIQNDNP